MLGMTLGMVVVPESTALIFGKKFGKNRFSYFISPKKTWEGFVGQYLGVIAGYLTIEAICIGFGFSKAGFSFTDIILMGLLFITIAIIGDLMESVLKRSLGTKQSGQKSILGAGLGGFMDKYDSLGVVWITMSIIIKLLRPELFPQL